MSKLSVGVVFGGRSVEHDVSIVTAHQAMDALAPDHDIVPIYITREGRWLTGPGLNDIDVHRSGRAEDAGEEAFLPPVAGYGGLYAPGARRFPAPPRSRRISLDAVVLSVHGTFGEDGTLQGLMELADIPYTGPGVVGSAVGMDKVAMKALFRSAGLPVVPHVLVDVAELDVDEAGVAARVAGEIGYPAFVKPSRTGSSVGIGKVRDESALGGALDVARRYDRKILVERSMEGCIEVNCSVLGGAGLEPRVSVCEQPVPWEEFLSFSDKYMRGGKGRGKGQAEGPAGGGMASQDRRIPAPIPDEATKAIQENAVEAFRAVDAAGVARIDSFFNEATGETWVMEINTVPGSFSFYLWEASGLPFQALMQSLLDIALRSHASKSDLMFTFESGMLAAAPRGKSGRGPAGG